MKRYIIALAAVALFAVQSDAARVFLSSSATDPTATEAVEIDLLSDPTGAGQAYVWITPDAGQVINSMALDIIADTDTIRGTAFEIDNPTAGLGSTRWNPGINSGTFGQGLLVDNSAAVAVLEVGVNQAFAQFDQGVVVDGSFLHGTLSFAASALGDYNLSLGVGDTLIADQGTGVFVPDFGDLGVSVTGIPEPSTCILASLALVGFTARRNG